MVLFVFASVDAMVKNFEESYWLYQLSATACKSKPAAKLDKILCIQTIRVLMFFKVVLHLALPEAPGQQQVRKGGLWGWLDSSAMQPAEHRTTWQW